MIVPAECVGQAETVPMYYLRLTGLVLVSIGKKRPRVSFKRKIKNHAALQQAVKIISAWNYLFLIVSSRSF